MRILYICHRLPYPPNRGGKIRPFYMIKHLAREHEVVVASLTRSAEEARDGEELAAHCSRYFQERIHAPVAWGRMIARLPGPLPSSMGYFRSARLARRIREELRRARFDLIFVHCSSVAQYVEDVRDVPKILDFGDMDSQKWLEYARYRPFPLSLGYWLEGKKMERAEKALARKFDLCTTTTFAEQETLDGFGTGTPSAWFPNGVNAEYFKPGPEPRDPDLLSFIGRMDYFPNEECVIDFCKSTLPLIRRRRPGAKLVVVGANPPPSVKDLARIPGVEVTGFVADVRPWVRRSTVCIAPLRIARGTQNKILESLAMGVPTVASVVAAGGIDAVAGEHFLTASGHENFAAAVLSILDDPALAQRLSESGRDRMLSHHHWEASMKRMDVLIESCIDGWRGSRSARRDPEAAVPTTAREIRS